MILMPYGIIKGVKRSTKNCVDLGEKVTYGNYNKGGSHMWDINVIWHY